MVAAAGAGTTEAPGAWHDAPATSHQGSTVVDVAVQTDSHLLLTARDIEPCVSAADSRQLDTPASLESRHTHAPLLLVRQSSSQQAPLNDRQEAVVASAHVGCDVEPPPAGHHLRKSTEACCSARLHDSSRHSVQTAAEDRASASATPSSSGSSGKQVQIQSSSGKAASSSKRAASNRGDHITAEHAHRMASSATADSSSSAFQMDRTRAPVAAEGPCDRHPRMDSEQGKGEDRQKGKGRVPTAAGREGERHKARGAPDQQRSVGLQLPQKVSIASLAKHAGVDKAFMQVSELGSRCHAETSAC